MCYSWHDPQLVCSSQNTVQGMSKHHGWHNVLVQPTIRNISTSCQKPQNPSPRLTWAKPPPSTDRKFGNSYIFMKDAAYKLDSAKSITWEWVNILWLFNTWFKSTTKGLNGAQGSERDGAWPIPRKKLMLPQNVSASTVNNSGNIVNVSSGKCLTGRQAQSLFAYILLFTDEIHILSVVFKPLYISWHQDMLYHEIIYLNSMLWNKLCLLRN